MGVAPPLMFQSFFDIHTRDWSKDQRPHESDVERWMEKRSLGTAMIQAYMDFDYQECQQGRGFITHATEFEILVPVRRPSGHVVCLYYIRADGIVEMDGQLWVLEHKTCAAWWSQKLVELDEQFSAYALVASLYFGVPIAGVLVNFLLKEELREVPILKNGRPTTDFRKLAYVPWRNYRDAVSATGPQTAEYVEITNRLAEQQQENGHPTIRRQKVYRSAATLALQKARIIRDAQTMVRLDVDVAPAPNFIECPRCPVYEVCLQMEEGIDPTALLETLTVPAVPMWAGVL